MHRVLIVQDEEALAMGGVMEAGMQAEGLTVSTARVDTSQPRGSPICGLSSGNLEIGEVCRMVATRMLRPHNYL